MSGALLVLWASGCGSRATSGETAQAAGTGSGETVQDVETASGGDDMQGGTVEPAGTAGTPPEVAWEWLGEDPSFGHTFYQGPVTAEEDGTSCSFTYDDEAKTTHLACEAGGAELWSLAADDAFVEDAALAMDGGTLYVARFSDIATGCGVTAYDAATGEERWSTRLQGVGPIGHSEYLNKVELRVLDARWVAAFGWESAGCYIEVLDRANGQTVVNRLVEPGEMSGETSNP